MEPLKPDDPLAPDQAAATNPANDEPADRKDEQTNEAEAEVSESAPSEAGAESLNAAAALPADSPQSEPAAAAEKAAPEESADEAVGGDAAEPSAPAESVGGDAAAPSAEAAAMSPSAESVGGDAAEPSAESAAPSAPDEAVGGEAAAPSAEAAGPSAKSVGGDAAEPSAESVGGDVAEPSAPEEAIGGDAAEPSAPEEAVGGDAAAPSAEAAAMSPSAESIGGDAAEPSAPTESVGGEAAAPSASDEVAGEAAVPARPWQRHYPEEVPPSLTYPDGSIVQFLLDAVNRYPQHQALSFMGKTMTYRELHRDAVQLATRLVSLGISKGDRVAIMLPNCPQAVVSYYGVLLAGAVVVQTNPLYVERELEHQLKDSGASALITLDLLYARTARVRGEEPESGPVPRLKHVIVTSIKDGLPFPKNMLYPIKQRKEGFRPDIPYGQHGVLAYRKLLKGNAEGTELPPLSGGDELAALQYTGGTTGTPKGVMLTHRNFVTNTMQIGAWCYKAEDGKERFLAALPLFHVFGLTVLMNMSVMRAGSLILLPRFETETVLKTISEQRPTIFPGAPTMYVALINHAHAAKLDMSSINVCISGSAALPLEVQDKFEALTGGRLIEGYGLTEATPVTHANPIWGRRKIGTIGVPLPDTEAMVADLANGKPLPPGELGELLVRGPQVMRGYWNKPEETAKAFKDGWLRTGDLAKMDEDGYFTIMDRIKDIIIAGGFNIYPREVEEVLFEHPAVREAAVVGIKDPYRGETVKAYVVLKEGWQISASQLDRWCRDQLAAFKVPHHYVFRDSLPKTMVGKVLRRKLLEEDEAEAGDAAGRKE